MHTTRKVRRMVGVIAVMSAMVIAVMLPRELRADTFTVTKIADTGSSCSASDCSLRQAISAANANPGPDTIIVPAGNYVLAGAAGENSNATGDLDITGGLTITGDAAGGTIIDGGGNDRVFDIQSTAGTVTLQNLTIQNGNPSAPPGAPGGGIQTASTSSLVLENCKVQNNQSSGPGGGLFASGQGPISLTNTSFLGNIASNNGGGLAANNAIFLEVTGGTFDSNKAGLGNYGGAIAYTGPGSTTISGAAFTTNTAANAGALYLNSNNGPTTLTNVTISGNTATADVGGLQVGGKGDVAISGSTISGNQAKDDGGFRLSFQGGVLIADTTISGNKANQSEGGGYITCDGNVELRNVKIQNNVAEAVDCGGLCIPGPPNVKALSLVNVEVSGNTAAKQFGGILAAVQDTITATQLTVSHNAASAGTSGGANLSAMTTSIAIDQSTFSGNSSTIGIGGLEASSPVLTITNTTVDGNTTSASSGAGLFVAGGVFTLTGSTISNNTVSGASGGGLYMAGSKLTATNDTFSANSTTAQGGGLYVNGADATLTNVTFQGNAATTGGGGIFVHGGTTTLQNTIVAGSTAGHDCGLDLGSLDSGGHNIATDATCNLTVAGDLPPGTDPLLTVLADHGGPTFTHALQEGSPAIDAGDNALSPTDQRGVIRPIDGDNNGVAVADIGAVEAGCGDGVLNVGEQCDNGVANSDTTADACRRTCMLPKCGDGVVDTGEQCDNGAANSDTTPDACRTTCTSAKCGDGIVDTGEECDDGNTTDGDGCSSTCTTETPAAAAPAEDTGGGCNLIPMAATMDPAVFWRAMATQILSLLR